MSQEQQQDYKTCTKLTHRCIFYSIYAFSLNFAIEWRLNSELNELQQLFKHVWIHCLKVLWPTQRFLLMKSEAILIYLCKMKKVCATLILHIYIGTLINLKLVGTLQFLISKVFFLVTMTLILSTCCLSVHFCTLLSNITLHHKFMYKAVPDWIRKDIWEIRFAVNLCTRLISHTLCKTSVTARTASCRGVRVLS